MQETGKTVRNGIHTRVPSKQPTQRGDNCFQCKQMGKVFGGNWARCEQTTNLGKLESSVQFICGIWLWLKVVVPPVQVPGCHGSQNVGTSRIRRPSTTLAGRLLNDSDPKG